jgi:hypothetical protein
MGWQFNGFIYFDNELGYHINMDYMVFLVKYYTCKLYRLLFFGVRSRAEPIPDLKQCLVVQNFTKKKYFFLFIECIWQPRPNKFWQFSLRIFFLVLPNKALLLLLLLLLFNLWSSLRDHFATVFLVPRSFTFSI